MPPLLSVCMITYGHEKYILQAIESVLAQNTEFDFELVIGEDCSPDGTRAIVQQYADQNPGVVRPLMHESNLGPKGNWIATLEACRGKYIAALEGDDYWTDSNKLSRQVAFLEANPEYILCGHDVDEVDDRGEPIEGPRRIPPIRKDGGRLEIVESNFVPTCSAVFRRRLPEVWPQWYRDIPVGDYPLWVWLTAHGRIRCFSETMGAYRIHPEGIWSKTAFRKMKNVSICMFAHLDKDLDRKFHGVFASHIVREYRELIDDCRASRDFAKMLGYACKALPWIPATMTHRRLGFRDVLKKAFRRNEQPDQRGTDNTCSSKSEKQTW